MDITSLGIELISRFLGGLLATRSDHHTSSLTGKHLGDTATNSLRTAGYNDRFSFD
jgi:hypothetical protein